MATAAAAADDDAPAVAPAALLHVYELAAAGVAARPWDRSAHRDAIDAAQAIADGVDSAATAAAWLRGARIRYAHRLALPEGALVCLHFL